VTLFAAPVESPVDACSLALFAGRRSSSSSSGGNPGISVAATAAAANTANAAVADKRKGVSSFFATHRYTHSSTVNHIRLRDGSLVGRTLHDDVVIW
jgi:hypothetical protein